MCKINGKKLGELRAERGISQRKLAKEAGISQNAISGYENGIHEPSEETLDKICLVLNVNRNEVEIHDVGFSFTSQESRTVAKARKRKGFVRLLTPEQTEGWIKERRSTTNNEEKEVQVALNSSFGIGKKRYILIDPTMIHIPTWQRDTDMAKAMEIADNFDEDKFDPIKVYIDNGKLNVADGAHRVIAFVLNSEIKILVEVLGCSEHEATLTFLGQSSGRKTMTVNDTYRAGVKANIKEYIDFKNFCESHDIQITAESELIENPLGTIRPSSTILRLVKNNREMLEKTVNLIKKMEWSGSEKNTCTLRNFQVIKRLYTNFGEEIEKKMEKNCKGAAFYESKVVPVKSNAELFDILSSEINK